MSSFLLTGCLNVIVACRSFESFSTCSDAWWLEVFFFILST